MFGGLIFSIALIAIQVDRATEKLGRNFGYVALALTLDGVGAGDIPLKLQPRILPSAVVTRLAEGLPSETWDSIVAETRLLWLAPVVGFGTSLVGLWLIGSLLRRENSGEEFIRGGALVTANELAKKTKKLPVGFHLGGVPVPVDLEPMHFLVAGSTGSGKTVTFAHVLDAARENGQRAILADSGGEFLRRYFRSGDTILNPFDERGADWSPFAEMRGVWDAERIAKSLIPDGVGSAEEWNGYAQQFLSAALQRLWEAGKPSNGELVRVLTVADHTELKALVQGLPAQRLFSEGNEKFLGSVLAIVASFAKPLAWLDPATGKNGFAIRDWVEGDNDSWIFLTYRDDQLASLRRLIAAQLDMLTAGILSLPPDPDCRIWLGLDEFASLGKIQSIEPFLAKARKYGGCGILGLQVLSQLQESYGDKLATTILGNLGTWVVGQTQEPKTQEFLSQFFGKPEILRTVESGSLGGDGAGTISQQFATKTIVALHELRDLPPKHAYLKLKGDFLPCRIVLGDPPTMDSGHPAFLLKELRSVPTPPERKAFDFSV